MPVAAIPTVPLVLYHATPTENFDSMACGNIRREAIVAAEHIRLDPESKKVVRAEIVPWLPIAEQPDWRR